MTASLPPDGAPASPPPQPPSPATPATPAPGTAPADGAGRARVRDYGDPRREYAALRSGALVVDHGGREVWTFRGAKARETLTGLVTNDVLALGPGQGCYAAALTAKGRIVADVRILALDDPAAPAASAAAGAADGDWLAGAALLVDVPERAVAGWGALVRKYVNPRVAPYRREAAVGAFGVYGAHARDALAAAFGAPPAGLAALPPYGHLHVTLDGGAAPATFVVARVPDLGVDGFHVVGPTAALEIARARVLAGAPGALLGGALAHAIARVEAGYPEWGLDIDDTTIPQEANLDDLRAISYTKGCYTGQEVVARVHFRGHVNRHLRGLAWPAGEGTIPSGAELVDESGKAVGAVRTSAVSPRLGGVALGMVRREVPLGAVLLARWPAAGADGAGGVPPDGSRDAGERRVTVTGLPFPG